MNVRIRNRTIKQRLPLLILVLILKEKAVSGMLAAAHRGDTGVKQTIRQKSVAVQTTAVSCATTQHSDSNKLVKSLCFAYCK